MAHRRTDTNLSKRSLIFLCIGTICVSISLGIFGGFLAYRFSDTLFGLNENTITLQTMSESNESNANLSTAQIVELVADSVVEIKSETSGYNVISESSGSGVIFTADGYIVTNQHVIDGADKITVTLRSGSTYNATIIGANEKEDIAVIKIDKSSLTPIIFGDSDKIKVGEEVIVIGNPLGQLGGSVTDGVISAVNRTINLDGVDMNLIQTNAEINNGNSGGGMFGRNGEFVGLVVAKSSGTDLEGLGFAIPSNKVKDVINQIL